MRDLTNCSPLFSKGGRSSAPTTPKPSYGPAIVGPDKQPYNNDNRNPTHEHADHRREAAHREPRIRRTARSRMASEYRSRTHVEMVLARRHEGLREDHGLSRWRPVPLRKSHRGWQHDHMGQGHLSGDHAEGPHRDPAEL